MSIYGHYTQQYYGNKEVFPAASFLISGTSFHGENCKQITYDSVLHMEFERDNKYDADAICIRCNENPLGYVPNNPTVKEYCAKRIDTPLKVVNIKKVKDNYGIRVSFGERK